MTSEFVVSTTSRFRREIKQLAAGHPGLPDLYRRVVEVLKVDPYNRTREHGIKKLEGVAVGDGQYRVRSGRFRFRYDIDGRTVYLKACSLRREDTY
jgi:mRNA-degrading endonuclease RelE of RelBE toxin-antitoxin system